MATDFSLWRRAAASRPAFIVRSGGLNRLGAGRVRFTPRRPCLLAGPLHRLRSLCGHLIIGPPAAKAGLILLAFWHG